METEAAVAVARRGRPSWAAAEHPRYEKALSIAWSQSDPDLDTGAAESAPAATPVHHQPGIVGGSQKAAAAAAAKPYYHRRQTTTTTGNFLLLLLPHTPYAAPPYEARSSLFERGGNLVMLLRGRCWG